MRSKFLFQKSDIYVNFLEWDLDFEAGKGRECCDSEGEEGEKALASEVWEKGEGAPGLSGAPSRGVVEMFSIRAEDQQQRVLCRQRCFRIS